MSSENLNSGNTKASGFSLGSLVEIIASQQCSTKSIILWAIAVALCLFIVKLIRGDGKMVNIPAIRGGLPWLGQALKMIDGSPWDLMSAWARQYGNLYKLNLFGNDSLVVSDRDVLKYVYSIQNLSVLFLHFIIIILLLLLLLMKILVLLFVFVELYSLVIYIIRCNIYICIFYSLLIHLLLFHFVFLTNLQSGIAAKSSSI